MSIVTQGYSDHGTLVTQGYGVGRGIIGAILDLFKPQIKAIKQKFQIKCLS
jgi:hypothetical protein